jgi:DNA ligase-associated metallophosphoesterase
VIIDVNGERLYLDTEGALWWPDASLLVFADLHLEKGSAYAARHRIMLPPYDTRATLARMEALVERYRPNSVIALGDSFHDQDAAQRLDVGVATRLHGLVLKTDWLWIAGNHDPLPPTFLGGKIFSEIAIGNLVFRHEPLEGSQPGEIAGHLHPCATVVGRGRGVRRRCFASDGARMILPAMGAYAGGLDVRDDAISSLFGNGAKAYLLGAERVYAAATF